MQEVANVAQSAPMDAQIVIRLPMDLKERCEQIAKREMMSLSDIARQSIRDRVERDEAREVAKTQPSTSEVAS